MSPCPKHSLSSAAPPARPTRCSVLGEAVLGHLPAPAGRHHPASTCHPCARRRRSGDRFPTGAVSRRDTVAARACRYPPDGTSGTAGSRNMDGESQWHQLTTSPTPTWCRVRDPDRITGWCRCCRRNRLCARRRLSVRRVSDLSVALYCPAGRRQPGSGSSPRSGTSRKVECKASRCASQLPMPPGTLTGSDGLYRFSPPAIAGWSFTS